MHPHREYELTPGGTALRLGRTARLMGILNVTPDSFSDGGRFDAAPAALAQARAMLAEGADIIDIGGESTRPGADEVSVADELERVLPAIKALRADGIAAPISIDTYKAEVAARAIGAGATIVNDVHGLQREPEVAAVAAQYEAPLVVMHWDKARDTTRDVIAEMARYFDVTNFSGDRIILRELGLFGYHGVMPEEAVLGQRFFIDLVCGADLSQSGRSDELEHSISYADIHDVVKAAFEERRFKLIEAVGQHIVDRLFDAFPPIQWIEVRVRKPSAPIAMVAGEAAIELRQRSNR